MVRRLWRSWRELAGYIGEFQARLLLTVFYFVVATLFAVVGYLVDPLRLRKSRTSGWVTRSSTPDDLAASRRQF